MTRRLLQLISVAALLMAVVILLKLAPTPVAGQGQEGTASVDPTPWGDPNLQGIWTTDYETPLQRPTRYANKDFFTDEERDDLDRLRADSLARNEGRTQYAVGAYNAGIFLSHKHTGRRTSLIVDPPDGRIPPLTPEAQRRRDAIREYQLALLQATEVCKNNHALFISRALCNSFFFRICIFGLYCISSAKQISCYALNES